MQESPPTSLTPVAVPVTEMGPGGEVEGVVDEGGGEPAPAHLHGRAL